VKIIISEIKNSYIFISLDIKILWIVTIEILGIEVGRKIKQTPVSTPGF
jgi:hypothetical protein